jgi:hypothetical protein
MDGYQILVNRGLFNKEEVKRQNGHIYPGNTHARTP